MTRGKHQTGSLIFIFPSLFLSHVRESKMPVGKAGHRVLVQNIFNAVNRDESASYFSSARNAFGCAFATLLFVVVIMGFERPGGYRIGDKGYTLQATNNAQQVMAALRTEPPPSFPAGTSSNKILRTLLQAGYVEDERIFGAPMSPYVPDNDIGDAPDYPKALERGELHWCLFAEAFDDPNGNAPVVFDNPIDGSWPPKWNAGAEGRPVPGRTLKGGKIIVGLNDGSVVPQKLHPQPDGTATADEMLLDLVPSRRFNDIER